jgi:hypothetical protein
MRVLIRLTAPFYTVVDQLVDELQEHVWAKSGKPKRRLKGDGLEKLHYSVECLVRGCVAVVLQRNRKSEAAIRKGQYYYSSERPDQSTFCFLTACSMRQRSTVSRSLECLS